MSRRPNHQVYVLGAAVEILSSAARLTLQTPTGEVHLEGSDAALVRRVCRALSSPRTAEEVSRSARTAPGATTAALDLLVNLGVAATRPALRVRFRLPLRRDERSRIGRVFGASGLVVEAQRTGSAKRSRGATPPALDVFGPFDALDARAWEEFRCASDGIAAVGIGACLIVAGRGRSGLGCARCAVLRYVARMAKPAAVNWLQRRAQGRTAEVPGRFSALELANGLTRFIAAEGAQAWEQFASTALVRTPEDAAFLPRPVLRHPDCPLCGPMAAPLTDLPERADIARRSLFDGVLGPLHEAELADDGEARFRGLPLVWGGFALVARGHVRSTGLFGTVGTGFNLERRRRVVLFEGIERYALRLKRPDVFATTPRALGERAISPSSFPLYSAAQYATPRFPFAPPSADAPLDWVAARHLWSGKTTLVPFEAVSIGYSHGEYAQRAFETLVSSGAAAHRTERDALTGALRELVERDAFMIAWLKRLRLPRITLPDGPTGDAELDELLRFLRPLVSLTVVDLRLDIGMPACAVVARSERQVGALAEGSRIVTVSGGSSATEALRRALMELTLHWEVYALSPSTENDWRSAPLGDSRDGMEFYNTKSASLWTLDPAHAEVFAFLERDHQGDPPPVSIAEIPDWPGDLGERLTAAFQMKGMDAWVVETTPPDLAVVGARSLRVVAPGLVPLEGSELSRRVPLDRLESVAAHQISAIAPGETATGPHPLI